jgi:hypothetical protein
VIRILLLLIVLGLVWWLIGFLPLPDPFPTLIRVLLVLALIWELLALAGAVPSYLSRGRPLD